MKKTKKESVNVFVTEELNHKESMSLAKDVSETLAKDISDLAKKVRAKKIKAQKKKVRPDFYHDMAVATRIKGQNGGCCR